MRSNPTPSAPWRTAWRASSRQAMLASTSIATPSVVIAGRLAASSRVLACLRCPSALSRYCSNDSGVRVDHDDTVGSVDEDRGAVGDVEHVMTGADHCRYPESAGEDRAVREWAAGCGDDAEHFAGVESRGLGWCQVVSHDDAGERVGEPSGVAETGQRAPGRRPHERRRLGSGGRDRRVGRSDRRARRRRGARRARP